MDLKKFQINPFIWIWIGSRLDFGKSNPCPPLIGTRNLKHGAQVNSKR